jgi:D-sedoheptulose 7-phosphate isomerase
MGIVRSNKEGVLPTDPSEKIRHDLLEHVSVMNAVASSLVTQITTVADLVLGAFKSGRKVLLMGNGGSAADAQHIAAELIGRFKVNRKALPAIALTTDTSILTAVGNDYSFDDVFSRQVSALGNEGDIVIGISTSGNSPNVLNGIRAAKEIGCKTIGMTGKDGGELARLADLSLTVPSRETPRIQEAHITVGHIICSLVEQSFLGDTPQEL